MSKTIVSVAYGDVDVTDAGKIEGIVEYADGSSEPLTTIKRVKEVMKIYQEQMLDNLKPQKVNTNIYLHSSKDSNWETAGELGLSEEASKEFAYSCYEVRVGVQVDTKTGKAVATHFNGVKLENPVEV